MSDKAQMADSISARRASCGYRIQLSCASCVHCKREYHAKGHVTQMMDANCDYNDFPVNLDRGLCEYFDHIGKYKE